MICIDLKIKKSELAYFVDIFYQTDVLYQNKGYNNINKIVIYKNGRASQNIYPFSCRQTLEKNSFNHLFYQM